jgi:hypothetical protein
LEIIANALVTDAVNVLKRNRSGYFYLPDDSLGEGIYIFENLNALTLELDVTHDTTLPEPEVDGEYYDGEGTIKVEVKLNPNQPIDEILELVVPELHELVTHEVVHFLQEESGLEFPKKIPKKPFKYYSPVRLAIGMFWQCRSFRLASNKGHNLASEKYYRE